MFGLSKDDMGLTGDGILDGELPSSNAISTHVINVLLADWNDQIYDAMHELQIENDDIRVVGISPDCNSVFENARNLHPEVIVAAYNLPGMTAPQFVGRLTSQYPHVPLLIMMDEDDTEHSGRVIHAGAKDIIVKQSSSIEALAEHIRRVYWDEVNRREAERTARKRRDLVEREERERRMRRSVSDPSGANVVRQRQQVISFYSPKGGLGTSVTAANVAMLMARTLARSDIPEEARLRICLVDADFGYGNMDVLFMLPNKTNIYDVVQTYDPETERFDPHALDKSIVRHPKVPGLDILLAPNRLEYHDYVSGEHIDALIRTLREREYDVIIFDTTCDLRETTIKILTQSQKIFFFTAQDVASIRLAEQVIDMLTTSSLQVRRSVFRLILSGLIQGNGVVPSDISEHLKMPIAVTLPDERRFVTTSINTGEPLAFSSDNGLVNAYSRLAGMVSPEIAQTVLEPSEPRSGGFWASLGLGKKSAESSERQPSNRRQQPAGGRRGGGRRPERVRPRRPKRK